VSVLAQLDELDRRLTGRPEAEYVHESRMWRLRLGVVVLLTLVSLAIALVSSMAVAGWLLVAFAIATGVKTVIARREWKASAVQRSGRWYEV
jgi:ABC-type transport system involved in cytochrome bd biosynthesis fused ATPase/permease subunit